MQNRKEFIRLINRLIAVIFFLVVNSGYAFSQKNKIINKSSVSVEILKTEKIMEPTTYYYYFTERDINREIVDTILIMKPTVYDYRVKDIIWSKDSLFFAYEYPYQIDDEHHIHIFDVKKRKDIFKTKGLFLKCWYRQTKCSFFTETLNQILFYKYLQCDGLDNVELSIFNLNTSDFSIDTLATIKTKEDEWWELPVLIQSDWINKKFGIYSLRYFPKQNQYKFDTIYFKI